MLLTSLLMIVWAGGDFAAALPQGVPRENPSTADSGRFGSQSDSTDPNERRREEKLENRRNVDRQQRLVSDTDKLLVLAKELKEEVAKSNKDTLAIDVVKKASEIEKLAKSVKERMRE